MTKEEALKDAVVAYEGLVSFLRGYTGERDRMTPEDWTKNADWWSKRVEHWRAALGSGE